MDRAFASGSSASAPTAPASPSIGYPTAGNPGTGTPATKPGPWWYHMITEEIRAVIVAAGITPSQSSLTQLLSAIQSVNGRPGHTYTANDWAYIDKANGLIVQWGSLSAAASSNSVTFPTSFASACKAIFAQSIGNNYAGIESAEITSLTTSGFATYIVNGAAAYQAGTIHWFAIGNI